MSIPSITLFSWCLFLFILDRRSSLAMGGYLGTIFSKASDIDGLRYGVEATEFSLACSLMFAAS